MKAITLFIVAITLMAGCNPSGVKKQLNTDPREPTANFKVTVYYFHGKQRCPTCIAVQQLTEETIKSHFSQNTDLAYHEIDLSKKENEELAEKYQVCFSSLIVASGDSYKNITDLAFANALRNPDFLKELIIEVANEFLNDGL